MQWSKWCRQPLCSCLYFIYVVKIFVNITICSDQNHNQKVWVPVRDWVLLARVQPRNTAWQVHLEAAVVAHCHVHSAPVSYVSKIDPLSGKSFGMNEQGGMREYHTLFCSHIHFYTDLVNVATDNYSFDMCFIICTFFFIYQYDVIITYFDRSCILTVCRLICYTKHQMPKGWHPKTK